MGRRRWTDDSYIEYRMNFNNLFKIDKKDFETLLKMYKFIPQHKYLCFYDMKRNVVVAKFCKNDKDYDILFNIDWIKSELNSTGMKLLIDICNKYPELYKILKDYRLKKKVMELSLMASMDNKLKAINKPIIAKIKEGLSDEDYEELIS